jgi:TolA-binding protein
MNCPKCGFAQEQRLDCKKCGVVFSKYYALYPSTKPAVPTASDDPIEQELLERERKSAIADLQTQIRELNARLEEMAFEKAERNQLRTDLKNLEKQLQENLDLTSSRFQEFDKFLGTMPAEGLEASEARAENFHDEVNQVSPPGEKEDDNSRKISKLQDQLSELRGQLREMQCLPEQLQQDRKAVSELQDQLSELGGQVREMRSLLEQLQQERIAAEPQGMLESDVRAIRHSLDQLLSLINKTAEPRP